MKKLLNLTNIIRFYHSSFPPYHFVQNNLIQLSNSKSQICFQFNHPIIHLNLYKPQVLHSQTISFLIKPLQYPQNQPNLIIQYYNITLQQIYTIINYIKTNKYSTSNQLSNVSYLNLKQNDISTKQHQLQRIIYELKTISDQDLKFIQQILYSGQNDLSGRNANFELRYDLQQIVKTLQVNNQQIKQLSKHESQIFII